MAGRGFTEVPVPPTSRATAHIKRRLLVLWAWEIRLRHHKSLAMGGWAFTQVAARRQAYAWATARIGG